MPTKHQCGFKSQWSTIHFRKKTSTKTSLLCSNTPTCKECIDQVIGIIKLKKKSLSLCAINWDGKHGNMVTWKVTYDNTV